LAETCHFKLVRQMEILIKIIDCKRKYTKTILFENWNACSMLIAVKFLTKLTFTKGRLPETPPLLKTCD